MMAMISPAFEGYSESLSTLKFATRAKKIKNSAKVNEDVDQRALLRKYEKELKKLRGELAKKSKIGDTSTLTQLESEKRKAEEDKNAAINALEARRIDFMGEQEEKAHLQ